MVGVQFCVPKATQIKLKCLDAGYLIGTVGENIIRMLPPLIITKEDIDGFIAVLDKILPEL
jgi:acetylornithine aminotransferase/acetylornithine/N-succinyldiaminopimelate aminotransferase